MAIDVQKLITSLLAGFLHFHSFAFLLFKIVFFVPVEIIGHFVRYIR